MSAASERREYVRSAVRGALAGGGWFGYAPLDRPVGWRERMRRRWRATSIYRLLTVPLVVRRARAAYDAELGT